MKQAERQALLAEARNLLTRGLLGQAEQACRRALESSASDVEALALLGGIALQQGAFERAESFMQRCAKLEPKDPSHQANLGKVRIMTGQLSAAVGSFDRALKLAPNFGPALAGKADALNQLGRSDEARDLLARFVSAKAETPDVGLIFATLAQQTGEHARAIEVVSRHLANPMVGGIVRGRLGLVLGKSYEALGDSQRAFQAYQQANAVRAESSQFDPLAYVQRIDRLIGFFTPERLTALRRARASTQLPIFIAGMPRSGTSLIEQIISSHPRGFGAGELTTLEQVLGTFNAKAGGRDAYPQWLAHADQAIIDEMSRAYLHDLGRLARGAQRAVDKYLRHHHHLGLIWMLFPGARVIHCKRDPMDSCFSCYTSALSPTMHGYCSNLVHLGLYYRQYERLMAHWRNVLDLPMLEVQYEQLVAEPEPMIRRIVEFAGLEWDDRCLRFHETRRAVRTLSFDQVRRPIYDKSIGRHKSFKPYLGPLKEALSQPQAQA